MNKLIKVTVVVPYYNDSKVFKRCIDSIFAQTIPIYEVIVIDDCSKDSNELQSLLKLYGSECIRYIRNDANHNAAYSRNLGIRLSKGDVIALLDADDFWGPEHLERSLNALEVNDADFIYSNVIEMDQYGKEHKRKVDDISRLINPYDIVLNSPPQTGSFVFYKKDMTDILFDESLRRHQDYQFLIDIIANKKKYKYLDTYTTFYCDSHRSFASRINFDSMFKFWNHYQSYFTQDKLKLFLIRTLCLSLRIKGAKSIRYYLNTYPVFKLIEGSWFYRAYKLIGSDLLISKVTLFLVFHFIYNSKNIPFLVYSKSRKMVKKKLNLKNEN